MKFRVVQNKKYFQSFSPQTLLLKNTQPIPTIFSYSFLESNLKTK